MLIQLMLPSGPLPGSILIISSCSLCRLSSLTPCPSLDTNGPDNQTFYNHLLPPPLPPRVLSTHGMAESHAGHDATLLTPSISD